MTIIRFRIRNLTGSHSHFQGCEKFSDVPQIITAKQSCAVRPVTTGTCILSSLSGSNPVQGRAIKEELIKQVWEICLKQTYPTRDAGENGLYQLVKK